MGNIINGETDQDRSIWAEEERLYNNSHPGRGRDTRFQGRHFRNKPERVDRAVCARLDERPATRRSSATGGILRQLISKARSRLARLEDQVKEQVDEIRVLESALERLESALDKT